jgi:hypothetical protein
MMPNADKVNRKARNGRLPIPAHLGTLQSRQRPPREERFLKVADAYKLPSTCSTSGPKFSMSFGVFGHCSLYLPSLR